MTRAFSDLLAFDDPAFIADPYPALAEIREQTPLFYNERTNQWMLTRFDDVATTLRDRRLGRAYDGAPPIDPRWAAFAQHERWSLLCLEPPDHTRLRRLVSKVFTPKAVARLRPALDQTASRLVEACETTEAASGHFDLLADFAQPYSVAVICSLLGVPEHDTQRLLDWSHAIVKMYELSSSEETKLAAEQAAGEYIAYTRALIAEKRAEPDELLVSQLAQVEDQGDTLTEDEIVSTVMVLLEAGHEATVNTIGNGFRTLFHHPDQWARLVSGEIDGQVALEELLRFDAPLQMFERWVLEPDVEIAGRTFEVGEEVAMLFGSAQRDPRRFDSPDTFDVGRNDSSHIGFGGGIHFCVGAPLARAELAVSIDRLVAHFPELEPVEEPDYHSTFVIRGLQALNVRSGG